MSSTLYWKPVIDYKGYFSDLLKYALRKKYTNPINRIFMASDIPFLEGLFLGGIEDANVLINLIHKHGSILVNERW